MPHFAQNGGRRGFRELVLLVIILVWSTVAVLVEGTPSPTLRPTRFPTTRAPSLPPVQCNSACFFGYLSNGQCDEFCNEPLCNYDGGECSNAPCLHPPQWIACMNATYLNDYVPRRNLFFNDSLVREETPESFFCNTTLNYYRALANCTATFQCWNLFDEFMKVKGWQLDFYECENDNTASDIILSKQCGAKTCQDVLPGSPTSAPSVATSRPTADTGPRPFDSTMLGIVIGGTIGGVVCVVLMAICYLSCTKSGTKLRLADKERRLELLDAEIARLEELNRVGYRGWFSSPGVREIQLERLENEREILEKDIFALQERLLQENKNAAQSAVATAPLPEAEIDFASTGFVGGSQPNDNAITEKV